ncbi:hypothetical protein [Bacillus sp. Marseille-P3661]|uniref:hypothetical protein n=1 Tax=Bacillus sp. Marseille-P3661 TaxID=1936234 RepID=UPI000C84D37F|nr:hypothetical protein [Bacillus sp. Marseille-P3661]
MNLLYFPENKLEYIPSLISLAAIIIITILVVQFVIRYSKKEEEKAKELERRLIESQTLQKNEHKPV